MPYEYIFNPAERLITANARGKPTMVEREECLRAMLADPSIAGPCNILINGSDVSSITPMPNAKALGALLQLAHKKSEARVAVASKTPGHGAQVCLITHAVDRLFETIRPFWNEAQAREWLSREPLASARTEAPAKG